MSRTILGRAALVCALAMHSGSVIAQRGQIPINVVTNAPLTPLLLDDLATHGSVRGVIPEINAVLLTAPLSELSVIQSLPYVEAANPDAER